MIFHMHGRKEEKGPKWHWGEVLEQGNHRGKKELPSDFPRKRIHTPTKRGERSVKEGEEKCYVAVNGGLNILEKKKKGHIW